MTSPRQSITLKSDCSLVRRLVAVTFCSGCSMLNADDAASEHQVASQSSSTPSSQAQDRPWFTWQELPLIILLSPVLIVIGAHIAGTAILIRKWFRVPYLVTMIIVYSLLTVPLWLNATHGLTPPAIVTAVVLLSLWPIAYGGANEWMEGGNFENSAPPHIILILTYLLLPAIYAGMDALSDKA